MSPCNPARRVRIVVLADSLALPRNEPPDVVLWEETWPAQLQKLCDAREIPVETINCAGRARTAPSLSGNDFYEHIELKRPDLVIVQVGVVDCAPRIISQMERSVMNRSWFPRSLRERIIRRRSERRAALTRGNPLAKVYTKPQDFADSLTSFGERLQRTAAETRVVLLPILGRFSLLDEQSPGYSANVRRYNDLLASFSSSFRHHWLTPESVVSPEESGDFFASDGYHLSPVGNRRIAARLYEEIFEHERIVADSTMSERTGNQTAVSG